jgi:hypothetical protein
MAITQCPDCSKDVSDAAPACPHCGRPSPTATSPRQPIAGSETRPKPVGILLGLGILFLPFIFAWATLSKGRSLRAKIIAFGWLAFCVWAIATSDKPRSTDQGASNYAPPVTATPKAVEARYVDIAQLIADYKGNEVAADNKYKGKMVQVTGIVGDIKKDFTDNLYVTLGTGSRSEFRSVQAFFDDSMNGQLSELSKGQTLTVVCRVQGLMMNVLAKDCVIK